MRVLPRLFAFAVLICSCCVALAEEPAGTRVSLFGGENLDGWKVTGCEAVVRDGVLLVKAGNGLIRTDHRYRDFVLELEWRALDPNRWDSGIYFRFDLPLPKGRPWPNRYQANLLKGQEGNCNGLEGAKSTGLVKPGEWNSLKLTVTGTKAKMEMNGKPAWEADGLEQADGYIALQAEVPGGGQFEFRNIFITELGYQALFNGRDLSGWETTGNVDPPCWQAEDGMLTCTGQTGSWLRSVDQFDDFNLRLQYKLEEGGNSGVYCRIPEGGNHHGPGSGIEVQVLDDTAERYKNLKPYQFAASLYAIVAAEPRVGLPAGRWNTLEINCLDTSYCVTHNGVVVVDADASGYPELKTRLTQGFLGFQNHRTKVWYKDLRFGPAVR